MYFGRVFPCPQCNKPALDAVCGLRTHERAMTLDRLKTEGRPGAAEMKRRAAEFIQNPYGLLSLYGDNGNGKTLVAMAIVNAMLERGIQARYLTGTELMMYLKEAFDPQVMDTDRARIERLARLPVLVIDEFEKVNPTPYASDMQQFLVNERYRNRQTVGTVFVWNGDLETLAWPAVVSRIKEFPAVHNTDLDLRPAIGARK